MVEIACERSAFKAQRSLLRHLLVAMPKQIDILDVRTLKK